MAHHLTADEVIQHLDLQPLAGEGGYYRQTYVIPGESGHPVTTAILFLVTPESWSGLHRLASDELFHVYLGDACQMVVLASDGTLTEHRLGAHIAAGEQVQVLVPGGTWQGTRLVPGGDHGWALLGTTMTPGFRSDQFELATAQTLEPFPATIREALRPYLAPDVTG